MSKKKQELSINIKKEENLSEWYSQVINKANLIEYTKVAGCMVFRPESYQIWEKIQEFFNNLIKEDGVKNAYFPLLIPESLLFKEKDHIEGFAPEVAWVDYGGNSKLSERLAIRPTSETIIYDSYSKWVRSYRDLPIRMNQWCSVVRWEFKHPTPFLRNREFLWQEGHSIFATEKEARDEVAKILDFYRKVYEDLLAIPVTLGRKSIGEKFAGAVYTLTAEPISPVDGKAIQACTSHYLGQNFSKVFDIKFLDKNQKFQYGHQNSWGLSTRSIGSLILIHGDDNGLILPPNAATNKIAIIPLFFKGKEQKVLDTANQIYETLKKFNPILDDREEYSAGFKFNEYELKGIPIRIELGPKDLENSQVVIVRRDTNKKESVLIKDISSYCEQLLKQIQSDMFNKTKEKINNLTVEVHNYADFKKAIEEKKRCLVPWHEDIESEEKIKDETGAKSSCIPFEFEKKSLENIKCFFSGKPATCWAFFSKSY